MKFLSVTLPFTKTSQTLTTAMTMKITNGSMDNNDSKYNNATDGGGSDSGSGSNSDSDN